MNYLTADSSDSVKASTQYLNTPTSVPRSSATKPPSPSTIWNLSVYSSVGLLAKLDTLNTSYPSLLEQSVSFDSKKLLKSSFLDTGSSTKSHWNV